MTERRPDRRPVASASVSCLIDPSPGGVEQSYHAMLQVALSLLSHVTEELRPVMIEVPGCAERLSPTVAMIEDVTADLTAHCALLDDV